MPEDRPQDAAAPTEEERGLLEILGHAPLILFALDGEGRLCLAEGGLVERAGLPAVELGEALLPRFEGTEIGEGLARGLRGERFEKRIRLGDTDFEVHYFPWTTPEGEPGTVGLVVDVTQRERALRALRESDERLRIITDRASEMITEQASDSRLLFVSRSFAEALGYEPDELLGRPAFTLLHPEDRTELTPTLSAPVQGDEPVRTRARLVRRDGGVRWIDAVSRSFPAADGTHHTVTVSRDVTGAREEEERRERRLALLAAASSIGSALVACPTASLESRLREGLAETGRLAGASRAVLVLAGEDDASAEPLWWTADPGHDTVPPDPARLVALARELVLRRGEVMHLPHLDPEDPQQAYVASRGSRSALAFPLRAGSTSTGFLGLTRPEPGGWSRDEIEGLGLLADALARGCVRLGAERAVEGRARLQSEITALGRGLLGARGEDLDAEVRAGLDLAARLSRVESCLIATWDPQDQRFLEVHQHHRIGAPEAGADWVRPHPWIEERLRHQGSLTLPSREAFPQEALATLPSAVRALVVVPIEITSRFVAFLAGWARRDLTPWEAAELERFRFVGELLAGALRRRQTAQALRESEEQLTQSQKMETVGRLAGHIAHDFNNLLTVIAGNAEVLAQEAAGPRQREDAQEIRRAAERAAQLTRDLLAFSRQRPGASEVVALNDVVRGVTALLERTLGDDIQLDLRLRPEAGDVDVEADRLRQIVVNLALNAREAMPKGGHLNLDTRAVHLSAAQAERLGVRGPGPHAVLEVRDEGEGVDPEILDRVFEPFFTTKRSGAAAGLGLSIAYSTLKEIGGAVEIQSPRGAGTCVRLYLPGAARRDART